MDMRRHSLASDASMTTQENCKALEQQLQKYEGDIRKHISIEHQLQLFAEDLKRQVSQLEKEKDALELAKDQQCEELRKDKLTLREFLDVKEKTLEENTARIQKLEQHLAESKVQMASQKQKYERQIVELSKRLDVAKAALEVR